MTAVPLFAALSLSLAAAPTYVLGVGARSELRLRHPGDTVVEAGEAPADAVDLETTAGAALAVQFERARLGVSYEPRFTLTNFAKEYQSDLLHAGTVSGDIDFRSARLSLSQTSSYGTRVFTLLSGARGVTDTGVDAAPDTGVGMGTGAGLPDGDDPTRPEVLPGITAARYASSDTRGSLSLTLTRRATLTFSLGYSAAGGIDETSRETVPFGFGPNGGVDYQYLLSRVDVLGTSVLAQWQSTAQGNGEPEIHSELVTAAERWQHRFSRGTTSEIALGVSLVPGIATSNQRGVYPVALAGLTHVEPLGPAVDPEKSTLTADALIETNVQIDRLTGLADRRFGLNVGVVWDRKRLTLAARAGHARSLGEAGSATTDQNALDLTTADFTARYEIVEPVAVEAGYRTQFQAITAPTTTATQQAADGVQWVAFVAVALTAPPLPL